MGLGIRGTSGTGGLCTSSSLFNTTGLYSVSFFCESLLAVFLLITGFGSGGIFLPMIVFGSVTEIISSLIKYFISLISRTSRGRCLFLITLLNTLLYKGEVLLK